MYKVGHELEGWSEVMEGQLDMEGPGSIGSGEVRDGGGGGELLTAWLAPASDVVRFVKVGVVRYFLLIEH